MINKYINDMIKNQQINRNPFYILRRNKNLSKLLPLLQFVLYVVIHFIQFLNALSCTPITLAQVLQIWIISLIDINRDSI